MNESDDGRGSGEGRDTNTQWAKGQGRRLGRAYCWGQGLSLCPLPALSEGLDSGLGKFASPFGELSE